MSKNSSKSTEPAATESENPRGPFQLSAEPVLSGAPEAEAPAVSAAAPAAPADDSTPPPAPPATARDEDLGALPDGYGSGAVYLIARDPHWLFTYWDIDWAPHPTAGRDGAKVYLKLFTADGAEESSTEIHAAARNWYLPAKQADAEYFAELVIVNGSETESVAKSEVTRTPPDAVSTAGAVDFATVPLHLSFEQLLDLVRATMAEGESLIKALSRVQATGLSSAAGNANVAEWTREQKEILATFVGPDAVDQIAMGSGEIEKLIRQGLAKKLQSESASELAASGRMAALWAPGESSLFSAFGSLGSSWSAQPFGQERAREFFMHVNAEIIFYGGTHPDAKVTVRGEPIQLRPDGSFRYHCKFGDGDFEVPIIAQSPDAVEERSATLTFRRATSRLGEVGSTAQPPELGSMIGQK